MQIVVDFEGPNDLEKVTLILSVSNPKNALRIKIFKNFQNRANYSRKDPISGDNWTYLVSISTGLCRPDQHPYVGD